MRSPTRSSNQETEFLTEDSDVPIQVERRARIRFPFEQRVRFRSLGQGYPVAGAGWVRNISSGGVLVMYQHEVSPGTALEMNIDWPTRLDGRIPLQLVVAGTVLRSESLSFALALERYHFRIAGRQDLSPDESLSAGA